MKNLLKAFTSCLLTWLVATSSFAQPGFVLVKDAANLKKEFKAKHESTKTLKSNFVQEKHLSFMKDKSISKGTLTIKQGKKIRMDYTSPFSYLIVINGDKLFIKEGIKVTKFNIGADKSFSPLNDILLGSMKGSFDESKEFTTQYFESKTEYLVELLPIDKTKGEFQKIGIFLNHENFQVARLELKETSGDITIMKFKDTQINIPVADEVFVLR